MFICQSWVFPSHLNSIYFNDSYEHSFKDNRRYIDYKVYEHVPSWPSAMPSTLWEASRFVSKELRAFG